MEMNNIKTAEYSAVINGWPMYATACGTHVEITPHMPEQLTVTFDTTGPCGGDSGHGGSATLTFGNNGAGYCEPPIVTDSDYGGMESTSLTVTGDWELGGLAAAMILLGRILEAQKIGEVTSFSMIDKADNILFGHAAWATPDPIAVDNEFASFFGTLPGAK